MPPLFGADPETKRRRRLEQLADRLSKVKCDPSVANDRAEVVEFIRSRARGRPSVDPPLSETDLTELRGE